jgi:hypothetical protein
MDKSRRVEEELSSVQPELKMKKAGTMPAFFVLDCCQAAIEKSTKAASTLRSFTFEQKRL